MKTAIVNIKKIISGDWRDPIVEGDSILMADGKIVAVGKVDAKDIDSADVVIDADGATGFRV